MELPMDKCTKNTFRGSDQNFNIMDQKLHHSKTVKDLGLCSLKQTKKTKTEIMGRY